MDDLFKPGTDNQAPGKYIEVGPYGGTLDYRNICTIERGERLPPTKVEGHLWKKL